MGEHKTTIVIDAKDNASAILKKVSGTMKTEFGGWFSVNKKINNSFANMTKDANRANATVSGLAGSFARLGRLGATAFALKQVADVMVVTTNSALETIETTNLFNVSLGSMAEEAYKTVDALNEVFGLDTTNLMNSAGTYAMLARSMGMSAEQAKVLSTNTSRLAIDLASLTNTSVNQVMQDLRSGLVGQSETVYKYGIDVTEAGIKAEAMAQGITKSVRNMSQGEKMALRYSAMIRQTSLAQGDFARTIDTPANQLKILQSRFTTLSRSIGSIFIPVLGAILPYANAVVMVLIKLANAIASFMGYKAPEVKNTESGMTGIADEADNATDAIGGVGKAVKKMKNSLLGIDEINLLPSQDDSAGAGGGTGVGGASILDGMELVDMGGMLANIQSKTDEAFAVIQTALQNLADLARPATEALGFLFNTINTNVTPFIFEVLTNFYKSFLVPVSAWTLGEGLPKLFDTMSLFVQSIDFSKISGALDTLFKAFAQFTTLALENLLWVVTDILYPMSTIAVNELLPAVIEALAGAFDLLSGAVEVLSPLFKGLYDNFFIPMGELNLQFASDAIGVLADVFQRLADVLVDNDETIRNIIVSIGSLMLIWDTTKVLSWIGQMDMIALSLSSVWGWLIKNTVAKLADKLETMALTAMYAKDAIMLGISKLAIIAHTVALYASTVATWLAQTATTAFGVALAILTSPITLVVLAIGALIAIVYLLIKNWDTVKEVAGKVWAYIVATWQSAGEWFRTNVTEPIGRFFTGMWEGFKNGASLAWEGIKKIFSAVASFFKNIFSQAWSGVLAVFSTGGIIFKGITEAIANVFKSIVNNIIKGINIVIATPFNTINGLLNTIRGISIAGFTPFKGLWGYNPLSIPKIPQLYRGGSLDTGALFQAGEFGKAEVIGSYGGKTTVMPLENTDFVQAMREAVFSGVISAMGNNSGGSGDIILQIGSTEFGRVAIDSINKVTDQEGRLLIKT